MTTGIDRDSARLAAELGNLLRGRGERIATAESCTGGLLAATLTSVPGASGWFQEGVVAYANDAKIRYLSVPPELIECRGAVSRETAAAMAEGMRRAAAVDVAAATTGIAGPEGGSPAKPVGTVFVAIADGSGTVVHECHFSGDRETIRRETVDTLLRLILCHLRSMRGVK